MKKLLLVLILAMCIGWILPGCGMVDNPQERQNRWALVTDFRARQFIDDVDCFCLFERNDRLTPWHAHIGY